MTSSDKRYVPEDGVPIPPIAYEGRRGRRGLFPLLDMKVGQSILLQGEDEVEKAKVAVANANTNHRAKGYRWLVGQTVDATEWRLWRQA
jgi:hypothetical protein